MTQEVVDAVEGVVQDVLNNGLHTAMPGKILAVYPDSGLVDVQPVGSFYAGNIEMEYPVVPGVPVCMMANELGIAVCIPLKEGDGVLLVCAEQSLSAFLTGTTEAQANERFELQNCIALPGLMAAPVDAQNEANEKDAVVIANGENKIVLSGEGMEVSGKVKLQDGLEVSGETTLSGAVSIKGNLTVQGNIHATGDISGANT